MQDGAAHARINVGDQGELRRCVGNGRSGSMNRMPESFPAPAALLTGVDFRNKNLGVSALGLSALALLRNRLSAVDILDWGIGLRTAGDDILRHAGTNSASTTVRMHGFRQTRKPWAADSMFLADAAIHTGLELGSGARAIGAASALLDASGGDSFADIYGRRRFVRVSRPKWLAIAMKRPLVLLPQTYGPYKDPVMRREAADIVAHAVCAVARDARSYEVLKELLGNRFDPSRHLVGTDMAFRLPTIDPPAEALDLVERARAMARGAAVAGVNVSGLIANAPDSWRKYGFRDDYAVTSRKLVLRLLDSGAGAVILLPHVIIDGGADTESDIHASHALRNSLEPTQRERVFIASGYEFPTEAKAIIRRLDWFTGCRLHATIGSLSNSVSTATIAYSDKARGIFEALGVGETVADPRVLRGDEVVEHQVRCFVARDRHRTAIAENLPGILATADRQMDDIARLLRTASPSR